MIILEKPTATLLSCTAQPELHIERCGRVSYKSEGLTQAGSAEAFIRRLIASGHESVLEHAWASILFVTDRGTTHQLVRHRLFSFTQESTRYCNYSKGKFGGEIRVVRPLEFNKPEDSWPWIRLMQDAEAAYFTMLAAGIKPEAARSVLPTCLATEIAVTGNFRQWRHFFKLRLDKHAQYSMRVLAGLACGLLKDVAPTVFEEFDCNVTK